MQTANIMLALGGDMGTTVPKYGVTASEIAVLMAIHGNSAVHEIEPTDDIKRSDRDEIRRLREIYGRARIQTEEGDIAAVNSLFPGAAAHAYQKLDELEIAPDFYKATSRAVPAPAKAEAPVEEMTKAELVERAKEQGVEIDPKAKKAEIAEAVKAAEGETEDAAGTDENLFG